MNAVEIAIDAGIDDPMIETLVNRFYARVREDDLIGPVFNAVVADWGVHLGRMCEFWSSVVLGSGRYHGRPMPKHAPLPVEGKHFDRWLALFCDTARAVCPAPAAAIFVARAQNIARSLEMGIAVANGVVLGPNERYERRPEHAEHPEHEEDRSKRTRLLPVG